MIQSFFVWLIGPELSAIVATVGLIAVIVYALRRMPHDGD